MNPFVFVAVEPSGFVTTISTLPAAWGGVVADICVSFTNTFVAITPPNVTFAPTAKPAPVMDTEVPPLLVPEPGLIVVIAGRMYANPFALVAADPLGFVTTTFTLAAT